MRETVRDVALTDTGGPSTVDNSPMVSQRNADSEPGKATLRGTKRTKNKHPTCINSTVYRKFSSIMN